MGKQRVFIGVTFLFALVSICLTVVSIATDHWVESEPKLQLNGTDKNEANFGIFKGKRILGKGLGPRHSKVSGMLSNKYVVDLFFVFFLLQFLIEDRSVSVSAK